MTLFSLLFVEVSTVGIQKEFQFLFGLIFYFFSWEARKVMPKTFSIPPTHTHTQTTHTHKLIRHTVGWYLSNKILKYKKKKKKYTLFTIWISHYERLSGFDTQLEWGLSGVFTRMILIGFHINANMCQNITYTDNNL